MDSQFNNSSGQPTDQKFNAPPPPEVDLRTMQSDISSVQKGESMPMPQSVLPPAVESEPVFRPETQVGDTLPGGQEISAPKKKSGKLWIWISLLIVIAGGGTAAYFFVYPSLAPAPVAPVTPPPAPTPITPVIPHNSYFLTAPQTNSELRLNNLLYTTIINSLQNLAATKLTDGFVQEVAILDAQGSQITFSSYLPVFAAGFTPTQLANWFEDDFTAFLYYDKNGVWPGYVAKIKNGANLDEVSSNLASLEKEDLSKFYLAAPGGFGPFKSGQLNGKSTRYAGGSAVGSSFNYALINGELIISTSYNGLKAAAPLLGL